MRARTILIAAAAMAAAVGCHKDYQTEYAGDIPLRVANKSPEAIEVHIMPTGARLKSERWGEPIPPGQTATFKIKAGAYDIDIEAGGFFGANGKFLGHASLKVAGARDLVVGLAGIQAPPNATLIVLEGVGEGGGGEGGGGEEGGGEEAAGEEETPTSEQPAAEGEACKQDRTQVTSAGECCSGKAGYNQKQGDNHIYCCSDDSDLGGRANSCI